MRIRYREAGVELQAHLIDELVRIHPEGRIDQWRFGFDLHEDDPRLRQILDWFKAKGMEPWPGGPMPKVDGRHFQLRIWREYEPADYVDVRYVRVWPTAEGNGLFRDEHGRAKMIEGQFPGRADFVRTPLSWIVVPERVKEVLEREMFRGVLFEPTVLVGGSRQLANMQPKPWSSHGQPWWELTSDIILPPLSPQMEMIDEDGNRVHEADCSRGCVARERLYVNPEYRYRASDLARVEPFDFARTAEVFGRPGHVDTWHYIASARFREFCVGHKWKCDWIPVRIDP